MSRPSSYSVISVVFIWIFLFHGWIHLCSSRVYVKTGVLDNGIPFEERDTVDADRETGAQMLQKVVRMMVNVHVHKPENPMGSVASMMMAEHPVLGEEREPLIDPEVELSLHQINQLLSNTFHNLDTNLPDSADVDNLKILVSKLEDLASECGDSSHEPDSSSSDEHSQESHDGPLGVILMKPSQKEKEEKAESKQHDETEDKKEASSGEHVQGEKHEEKTSSTESEQGPKESTSENQESGEKENNDKDAEKKEGSEKHENNQVIDIIGEPEKEAAGHETKDTQHENEIEALMDATKELVNDREKGGEIANKSASSEHSSPEPARTSEKGDDSEGDTIKISIDTKNKEQVGDVNVDEIEEGKKQEHGAEAVAEPEETEKGEAEMNKDEKQEADTKEEKKLEEALDELKEDHHQNAKEESAENSQGKETENTEKEKTEEKGTHENEGNDGSEENESKKKLEEAVAELGAAEAAHDESKTKEAIEHIEEAVEALKKYKREQTR